jgi:hypothetical protein
MVYLFVIKVIFQPGSRSPEDQYSCKWPLLPHGVGDGSEKPRTKTIAEDRKSDRFRLVQSDEFTLAEGCRNVVVGAS